MKTQNRPARRLRKKSNYIISLTNQKYTKFLDSKIKNELIPLQSTGFPGFTFGTSPEPILDRFSLVQKIITKNGTITPSLAILEGKKTSKSWNTNYLSHGWHRYVGRFPPQIIRSLLNIFRVMPNDTVLDPFAGSGTTLVECKLLGINSIGTEINPLSHLIANTKTKLDFDGKKILNAWNYVKEEFQSSVSNNSSSRENKFEIPPFPNMDKWFTKNALEQLTEILTLIESLPSNIQDFLYLAVSAGMRSIGNVDVDVVRSEYRKTPRENVDVVRILNLKLKRYVEDLETFKKLKIPKSKTKTYLKDFRKQKFKDESIDFIITSPPYGIESISYLRTHMLSYRVLQNVLNTSVDKLKTQMIGTDFVLDCNLKNKKLISKTSKEFLENLPVNTKSTKNRVHQSIKYFQDMEEVFEKMSSCIKKNCPVVMIIGNKVLLDKTIPTDKIFLEIAKYYGLNHIKSIPVKLICNNSTSKTPWSHKAIMQENILIFQK